MQHQSIQTRFTRIAVAVSLLLGASLLGVGSVYAKPDEGCQPGSGAGSETRIDRMTEQLDLTAEQQAEIGKIMDESRKQREQQRLEVRKQIDAVLTEEQKTKRESTVKERMDRRLERMTNRLDLTDDQADKIRGLFEEQQTNPELSQTDVRERMAEILTESQQAAMREKPKHHDGRERPDRDDH